jgi:hypothetical protein
MLRTILALLLALLTTVAHGAEKKVVVLEPTPWMKHIMECYSALDLDFGPDYRIDVLVTGTPGKPATIDFVFTSVSQKAGNVALQMRACAEGAPKAPTTVLSALIN